MGRTSTDVTQHQFPPYGEVDTAVTDRAQEEGEGRDERRKQRACEEKKYINNGKVSILFTCHIICEKSDLKKLHRLALLAMKDLTI